MERFDVRLAGLGGQGLLLAGLILGQAAVYDGKNVAQTVNYAPLARGAPSRSEVVISNDLIYYPEVEDADFLLAMSQDAYDVFKDKLKPGGIIVVDTDNVKKTENFGVIKIPISKIAETTTGRAITGSIAGLGILSKITGRLSVGALEQAIKARAPRGTIDLNIKALMAGFEVNA